MVPRRWWVRFSSSGTSGSSPSWRNSVLGFGVSLVLPPVLFRPVVEAGAARRPLLVVWAAVDACRSIVELAADNDVVAVVAVEEGTIPAVLEQGSDSSLSGWGGRRTLPARFRLRKLADLAATAIGATPIIADDVDVEAAASAAAVLTASSSSSSSSDTHLSQRIHPTKVPKLLQLTTETGLTRAWKMPTKQTMNMVTEQTCCRMMVESATRGQKS